MNRSIQCFSLTNLSIKRTLLLLIPFFSNFHLKVPRDDSAHFVHAREGGIVLLNVTEEMDGVYECGTVIDGGEGGSLLNAYILKVDGGGKWKLGDRVLGERRYFIF